MENGSKASKTALEPFCGRRREISNFFLAIRLKELYNPEEGVSATNDSEMLRAIFEKVNRLENKVDGLTADVSGLKEDAKITRNGVNTLLDWAEKAQVQVRIPLFKKGGS